MGYSYKPTTHGRSVMAACMSMEKPFKITRVAFGSGKVGEDTDLADVHQLLEYVSDGAVADRRHEDDRFCLTIQYANTAHPDVKTFMLTEFIVYVEDPETGGETDLLYGTLGDYRQPIPAYNPAYGPSVFNFPVTLILSDVINVVVAAPAGLATHDDLRAAMERMAGAEVIGVTIPAVGWTDSGNADYPYTVSVADKAARDFHIPQVSLDLASIPIAADCALCSVVQAVEGAVCFWAKKVPTAAMHASVLLIRPGGYLGNVASVLPLATADTPGAVKPGDGLSVAADGTLSVDRETVLTGDDLANEAEVAQAVADILN